MLSMPRIVRPDPHRFRGTEFGFPAGRATRRSIKRNKELAKSLTGKCDSQVSHSLPAHLERVIGDEAILDSRLGLNEHWTGRVAFIVLSVLRSVFQSEKVSVSI